MIDFQNSPIFKLSKVDNGSVFDSVKDLLIEGESIIGAYKAIRDFVVFTEKRVISVNVQGLTGKQKDYTSLPYSKISVFSVETAGTLDLDSELELYFSGVGRVKFEFSGRSDVVEIGRLISQYTLR